MCFTYVATIFEMYVALGFHIAHVSSCFESQGPFMN